MADISTKVLSLDLKSPIIAASGPLTSNIESLLKLEKAGVGAVVLKSIFEEELNEETFSAMIDNEQYLSHSDFAEVFSSVKRDHLLNEYLEFLLEAKKKLSIPVIASINCIHIDSWTEYASRFEDCHPDAIELNYYPIASDAKVKGEDVDRALYNFVKKARKATSLPLIIKIGNNYSSIAYNLKKIEAEGIEGVVLFNRFYRPDIDIEKEAIAPRLTYSSEAESGPTLRWIALMSAEMPRTDLIANTGIDSAEEAIKMLLAGAKGVEVCSTLMKNGIETVTKMNEGLALWMDKKGYKKISDFNGKLAQERIADPSLWERTQFMKTIFKGNM
jgi:Dihydroorotate dehydrogenase